MSVCDCCEFRGLDTLGGVSGQFVYHDKHINYVIENNLCRQCVFNITEVFNGQLLDVSGMNLNALRFTCKIALNEVVQIRRSPLVETYRSVNDYSDEEFETWCNSELKMFISLKIYHTLERDMWKHTNKYHIFNIKFQRYYAECSNKHRNTIDVSKTNTLLMIACEYGLINIVQLLVDYQINIFSKNELGVDALMIACHNGFFKCAKILLDAGANVNTELDSYTPLLLTILGRNEVKGMPCKHSRHVKCAKLLIDYGADVNVVNVHGHNVFHLACIFSSTTWFEMLITNSNIDINARDKTMKTALMLACIRRNRNFLKKKFRLKHKGDKNVLLTGTGGITSGNFSGVPNECVQLLINHGALVDLQDDMGRTALMYASYYGNTCHTFYLLNANANVDLKTHTEMDALLYAINMSFHKCLRLLLKSTPLGDILLMPYLTFACERRYDYCIKMLYNKMSRFLESPDFLTNSHIAQYASSDLISVDTQYQSGYACPHFKYSKLFSKK